MNKSIYKIALVGGPAAGKSVVLQRLQETYGENVLMVPEVATQLVQPLEVGGLGIPGVDVAWSQEWQDELQRQIVDKQIADELASVQEAELRGEPTVVVCDRGVLDGASYLVGGKGEFLEKYGLDEEACLALYDEIIHLNSLATDDPGLYEELKSTNASRFEGADRAARLDQALFEIYENHPNHTRITAAEGVERKVEAVMQRTEAAFQEMLKSSEADRERNPFGGFR